MLKIFSPQGSQILPLISIQAAFRRQDRPGKILVNSNGRGRRDPPVPAGPAGASRRLPRAGGHYIIASMCRSAVLVVQYFHQIALDWHRNKFFNLIFV